MLYAVVLAFMIGLFLGWALWAEKPPDQTKLRLGFPEPEPEDRPTVPVVIPSSWELRREFGGKAKRK